MMLKGRRLRGAGPTLGALGAAVAPLSIVGPATSAAAPLTSTTAALRLAATEGVTQVRHRRSHRYYRSTRNCYGCLGGRDGAGVPCRC
jgi:hypothetical protein